MSSGDATKKRRLSLSLGSRFLGGDPCLTGEAKKIELVYVMDLQILIYVLHRRDIRCNLNGSEWLLCVCYTHCRRIALFSDSNYVSGSDLSLPVYVHI